MVSNSHNRRIIRSYFTQQEAGAEVSLFFASVHCISCRPSEYRKSQKFYIVYGAILLALVTIPLASSAQWCQFIWIEHRNYPGGPVAFYRVSEGAWYNALGFAANAAANFLGDGLLVRPIST